jgi:hypothetical protein
MRMSKRTESSDERLGRGLCPIGKHGSLKPHGSFHAYQCGVAWVVLTCPKCGFTAIWDDRVAVPISSEQLESFSAKHEEINKRSAEALAQAEARVEKEYDRMVHALLADMRLRTVTVAENPCMPYGSDPMLDLMHSR